MTGKIYGEGGRQEIYKGRGYLIDQAQKSLWRRAFYMVVVMSTGTTLLPPCSES